jgi:hypothetical protein
MDLVSDHKRPVDAALDLLVYAPLGFALDARTLLPKLIDRGRSQIDVARWMGEHAVAKGQQGASRRLTQVQESALTALAELGLIPTNGQAPAPEAEAATPASEPASAHAPPPAEAPAPATGSDAASADLAIPDFDSLAASQVIPRLEGLSPEELEAVRAYEAGRRGRKTILNKIAQLQQG